MSLGVFNLIVEVFGVGDYLGELSNSVKNGSKNNWNLLNQGVSSQEDGELLGPLLDRFLFLVASEAIVESNRTRKSYHEEESYINPSNITYNSFYNRESESMSLQ